MTINNQKIVNLIAIIIVLSPILNIYQMRFLPINYGDLALLLCVVFSLAIFFVSGKSVRVKFQFISLYVLFFCMSLVIVLLSSGVNMGDFLNKWLRLFVFMYILDVISLNHFNVRLAEVVCANISLCSAVVVLIQKVIGRYGMLIFPYLEVFPLNYTLTYNELVSINSERFSYGIYRPSAWFPEPAWLAQYVLIGLIFFLFSSVKRHRVSDYVCAGILTLGVMVSGSALGIILCGLVWGIWLFEVFRDRLNIRKILGIIVVLIIGVIAIIQSGAWEKVIYRVSTINEVSIGSTGGTRLLQGLYVYKQLPLANKIFGVGFGNLSAYLVENSITTPFIAELGNEYMNSFSTVLVSGGMIGLFLYLLLWARLFQTSSTFTNRIILIVFFVVSLTSSLFYSCTTIQYFIFVCANDSNLVNVQRRKKEKLIYERKKIFKS